MQTPVNISHIEHNELPGHGTHPRPKGVGKYFPLGQYNGGRGLVQTPVNIVHSMHNGSLHRTQAGLVGVGKYQPVGQVSGGLVQTPVNIVHS